MDGIFVIGPMNVMLYHQFNRELKEKLIQLACENGLIEEQSSKVQEFNYKPGNTLTAIISFQMDIELDQNVILQLLNPILISQKMMFCQFDNNYSALVSRDKFNIAYEEYFGNIFIRMSEIYTSDVQKEILYNFVCFARLLCGPNIAALKDETNNCADFLRNVMHQWMTDFLSDYYLLLDGINSFLVAPDKLKSIATFMETELKVIGAVMGPKYHALLMYKEELVRIHSAPNMAPLPPHDVSNLFSLSHGVLQNKKTQFFNAFLNGPQVYDCIPHVVAVTNYSEFDLKLIIAVEANNTEISRNIHKTLAFLNKVYNFTVRLDADNVKVVVDKIDFYIGQVQQSLKAAKGSATNADQLDGQLKSVEKKWSALKKKLGELMKISYKDVLKQLDSSLPSLIEILQQVFRVVYIDGPRESMENEDLCQLCESGLVSALKGYHTIFSLNQHGLTVKSYMEEFPGLIHFIFINKTTGQIIAPELPKVLPIIDRKTVGGDSLINSHNLYLIPCFPPTDPWLHKVVEEVCSQRPLVEHLEECVILFLVLYVGGGEFRWILKGKGRDQDEPKPVAEGLCGTSADDHV